MIISRVVYPYFPHNCFPLHPTPNTQHPTPNTQHPKPKTITQHILPYLCPMPDITLQLDEKGSGAFYLSENGKRIGEMAISIKDNHLTVYHTEVIPEMEGKGLAKELLNNMVKYAS